MPSSVSLRPAAESGHGTKRRASLSALGEITNTCKRRADDDKVFTDLVSLKGVCTKDPPKSSSHDLVPVGSPDTRESKASRPLDHGADLPLRLFGSHDGSRTPVQSSRPRRLLSGELLQCSPYRSQGSDTGFCKGSSATLPAGEDSNLVELFDDHVRAPELNRMPNEILLLIFGFLSCPCKELSSLKFVCKKWRDVLNGLSVMRGRYLFSPLSGRGVLYKNQGKHMVHFDYLGAGIHSEVNADMRAILVDWLVEVSQEFNIREETLFLNVHLVDRFLSLTRGPLPRSRLQLLGLATLFIAAKYEEIYPPIVNDLVFIADNIYDRKDVVAMEQIVLTTLEFDISRRSARDFVHFFLAKSGYVVRETPDKRFVATCVASQDSFYLSSVGSCVTREEDASDEALVERINHAANYLVELAMLDYNLVFERPSLVAVSVVCLALHTVGVSPWDFMMQPEVLADHQAEDIKLCVERLRTLAAANQADNKHGVAAGQPLAAIHEKYADARFSAVSLLEVPLPLCFDAFA
eukprot:TRINITY_DN5463_c0_g1_i1.p1 TRINITY_DN5463_c0_g1~~TRINITY_DN5463_c0_g1_i1.p1  ORF type:complete len:522 (+),score=62.87 TRINITY_DN5463_c0_g1_i1:192-1757(+)